MAFRESYDRARSPLRDSYERARSPVRDSYERPRSPVRDSYERARSPFRVPISPPRLGSPRRSESPRSSRILENMGNQLRLGKLMVANGCYWLVLVNG